MEKSEFFAKMSKVGKALDSPERLRILDSLSQAARSVEDLTAVLELPVRTVSHHLQKLIGSGFVSCEGVIRFLTRLQLRGWFSRSPVSAAMFDITPENFQGVTEDR